MGGGLFQLAINQLPQYTLILNNNPSISFFDIKYVRYTNFSIEQIFTTTKIINPSCEQHLQFNINNFGDMLYRTYVVVELPPLVIEQPVPDIKTIKSYLSSKNIIWNTDKSDSDLLTISDLHSTDSKSINYSLQDKLSSSINLINFYEYIIHSINYNKSSLFAKYNLSTLTDQEFFMLSIIDTILASSTNSHIGVNLGFILFYLLDTKNLSEYSLNDVITLYLNLLNNNLDINQQTLIEINTLFDYNYLINKENYLLSLTLNNSDILKFYELFCNQNKFIINKSLFDKKLLSDFTINKSAINLIINHFNNFKFDIILSIQHNAFVLTNSLLFSESSFLFTAINSHINIFTLNILSYINSYFNLFSTHSFNLLFIYDSIKQFMNDKLNIQIDDSLNNLIINNINIRYYNSLVHNYHFSFEQLFDNSLCLEWIINKLCMYYNSDIITCFLTGNSLIEEYFTDDNNYNYLFISHYYKLNQQYQTLLKSLLTTILSKSFFESYGASMFWSNINISYPIENIIEYTFNFDIYKNKKKYHRSYLLSLLKPLQFYNNPNEIITDLNNALNENVICDSSKLIINLQNCKDLLLKTILCQTHGTYTSFYHDYIKQYYINDYELIYSEINNISKIENNINQSFLLQLFNNILLKFIPININLLFSNSILSDLNNELVILNDHLNKFYAKNYSINNSSTIKEYFVSSNNISSSAIYTHIKHIIDQQSIKYAWVNELGNRIIKNITLQIDNNIIYNLSSYLLHFEYLLFSTKAQQRGYNIMIGNTLDATTLSSSKSLNELWIPIDFYKSNGLPLISLTKSKTSIHLHTESLNNLLILSPNDIQLCNPSFKIKLLNEFVFFDKDERNFWIYSPIKQLITSYEHNGKYVFTKINNPVSIKLNINNATKFLIWYIKIIDTQFNDIQNWNIFGDPAIYPIFNNLSIKLNNQSIFNPQSETFFTNIQPWKQFHSLNNGEYLYSFSLYLHQFNPSGYCNLSLFDQCELVINFSDAIVSKINERYNLVFELWGNVYNILSIQNGYSTLLFC